MRANDTSKKKRRPALSFIEGWPEIRERIKERDHYTCQKCGATVYLEVHHKDRDRTNNADSNLITLCVSCHVRLHVTGKTHRGSSKKGKRSKPLKRYLVADVLSGKQLFW